jgi:hypothetical protein
LRYGRLPDDNILVSTILMFDMLEDQRLPVRISSAISKCLVLLAVELDRIAAGRLANARGYSSVRSCKTPLKRGCQQTRSGCTLPRSPRGTQVLLLRFFAFRILG